MAGQVARETWGSKAGFLLAAAGSAIGLGNIWRFPTVVGESGGAAFVLMYLIAVLAIGMPVMFAELLIGWQSRSNPVKAFQQLCPSSFWRFVGLLAVTASLIILSYYSVIASWTLAYIPQTYLGALSNAGNQGSNAERFENFTSNISYVISVYTIFIAITMMIVMGGIREGIERWGKVLMPLLFIILLMLVIRAVTLPGASRGLEFYLRPDFSKVTAETVLNAVSQAFFSLSLGMGIMITYGSYLSKDADLASSTFWVCMMDTLIAVCAGLVIFPALFTIPDLQPAEGPKLIFLVLPTVFSSIPAGSIFGTGFFALLTIAALTSSISLMEVVVTYLVEQWSWSRNKSVLACGFATLLLGLPSAMSAGALPFFTDLPIVGCSFLDLMDTIFGKFCLILVAMAVCIFVGWKWSIAAALQGVQVNRAHHLVIACWSVAIRFVCPVAMVVILLSLLFWR